MLLMHTHQQHHIIRLANLAIVLQNLKLLVWIIYYLFTHCLYTFNGVNCIFRLKNWKLIIYKFEYIDLIGNKKELEAQKYQPTFLYWLIILARMLLYRN